MTGFLLRRLASSAAVLAGVSVIVFLLARFIPTDAAAMYIGPRARPDDIERVRVQLGLDRDLLTQYVVYMRDMLGGDWARLSPPNSRCSTRSWPACRPRSS